MPLDRFVLILVAVISAAAVTVFLAAWLGATLSWPGLGLPLLLPIGLAGWLVVAVLRARLREARGRDG